MVVLQRFAIAVDQKPEEVEQLAFVETALGFTVDGVADFLDQLAHVDLVEEEGLVVVVHFFEEVDASHILADVVLDRWQVVYQSWLYVLVVPDQTHQEFVT